MTYSIRTAGKPDIPAIQSIARAVWPVAYRDILSESQLEYMLEMFYAAAALEEQMDWGHHFFLAEDVLQRRIGFASYSLTAPGIAHLHKLYVLPGTQGSGVGAELLLHTEMLARLADAATAMQLNVNRNNRAKGFYALHGYRVLLEEDIDIGRGYYMNDYRMEKELKAPATGE